MRNDDYIAPELRALVEAPLPLEEALRRLRAPLTEQELEEARELADWFTRRYPAAGERLAYVRRKVREWTRASWKTGGPGG